MLVDCSPVCLTLQALDEGLGREHASYARTLVAFADIARLTDDKPEAIALLQQALQIQDALGPPSAAGTSLNVTVLLTAPSPPQCSVAPTLLCTQQVLPGLKVPRSRQWLHTSNLLPGFTGWSDARVSSRLSAERSAGCRRVAHSQQAGAAAGHERPG